MKDTTVKISATIGKKNCSFIEGYAKKKERSRSKAIDIAISYFKKHIQNGSSKR